MGHCRRSIHGLLLAVAASAQGAEVELAPGFKGRAQATFTLGGTWRTDAPSPANVGLIPSTVVPGTAPGQLLGQTGGSDLNFPRHSLTSALAKMLLDVELRGPSVGAFVRVAAWHDLALGHRDAAYGNYPNGFQPGQPLSDVGFAPDARFSAVRLREAQVFVAAPLIPDIQAELRLGRQVQSWGVSQFFSGGLAAASNPVDVAAQVRPGALPQEAKVPVGMLAVSLTSTRQWAVQLLLPYEFRPANVPGCGSFFDVASVAAPGCNMAAAVGAPIPGSPLATMASLTERELLSSGYYVHRGADVAPSGTGQFGVDLRWVSEALATRFHAYAARTHHSLRNLYRLTVEDVGGSTLPPGVAGGLERLRQPQGLRYSVLFPAGTALWGLSWDSQGPAGARVYGELAYRPNQPIGFSPVDLIIASVLRSPQSLLAQRKAFLSVPAGGAFDAYDRFPVLTASLGAARAWPKLAGAERVTLGAELGLSAVRGLPDPTVMRYGRGLAYGAAPYELNGALTPCTESSPGLNGVPGKTCSPEGYVSPTAWGLRTRIAATYAAPTIDAVVTPSLLLSRDMKGYAHDGSLSEGRFMARLGLRADWRAGFFAELAFLRYGGGKYNLLADRSHLNLVAGVSL